MDSIILRASEQLRWEIPILYQDETLLAISKPPGLLTSPDRYDRDRPNLMALLHRGIRARTGWAREHRLDYLANVHRLDAETSGVLLLARSREALSHLAGQFSRRQTRKVYLALAHGVPDPPEQLLTKGIAPHPSREGLFVARARGGKEAVTRIKVLERFHRYSLLQAEPLTGRTHQIRVHLQNLGHAIVADALYGLADGILLSELKRDYRHSRSHPERPLIRRLALHAERVAVVHPVSGQPLEIVAPLPNDFAVALKYLRKYSPA